jgi:hypothetical protein
MPTVPDIHRRGTRADQATIAAPPLTVGALYFVTDEGVTERWTGSAWESYSGPGSGSAPTAHHATHETGGADAIAALAASVITTGTIASARLPARVGAVGLIIDGGGSVITTGVKGFVEVPFAGTITAVTVLSTDAAVTSGSIVIDIWKDTYANYPPTVADTITASAKPTLSSATKSRDTTLTGWTTAITAGDILGFKVDSVTAVTKVLLSLTVQAS